MIEGVFVVLARAFDEDAFAAPAGMVLGSAASFACQSTRLFAASSALSEMVTIKPVAGLMPGPSLT